MVLAFGVGSAGVAHATNAALPWESGLSVFMKSISGPVAGIISVLAICVCGGLLAMGAELNDIDEAFGSGGPCYRHVRWREHRLRKHLHEQQCDRYGVRNLDGSRS